MAWAISSTIRTSWWRAGRKGREVLSDAPATDRRGTFPTTEGTDRREKALHYKQIPTLEEYVLVAQESCEAAIYRRADSWGHTAYWSLQELAEFKSIGLSLSLSEIYAGLPLTA